VARMGRAPKRKRLVLVPKDYQYPGEKLIYLQAMGGVWALFLILAGLVAWQAFAPDEGQVLHGRHQAWIILLLYPALTVMGLNYLSARPRRRQLKQLGSKAKVMRTNHPEVYEVLSQSSRLLCMKEPAAYVISDQVPYLYSVPGRPPSIIVSSKCLEVLTREELTAAVSHELGHIKSGHVSVDLAIAAIRGANPLVQIVALPVTLMSFLMRGWLDVIDYTADRCALLVTKRLQVCTATMVKLAAAGTRVTEASRRDTREDSRRRRRGEEPTTDREMAADEAERVLAEISPEELDAYLAGGTEITDDPIQVERAFKISRFIEEHRNLRQRVRNLGEWIDTDQGEKCLVKMEQIRAQISGTPQSAAG
jgi:Zn-dependent protease with chaperone function